jgi:hypothetical protein
MRRAWWGRVAAVVAAVACALATPGTALAHPDPTAGARELFAGEGVNRPGKQSDSEAGSLPGQRTGELELVGRAEVTNPSGAGNLGRIGDVTGLGGYAYLTAFREPTCEAGGVHVMDIADPANPVEVTEAFIPTSPGSYAGEGVQVIRMDNPAFTGDLLVHNNETCDPALVADPAKVGGISLWDVTDPRAPKPLALHTGDVTGAQGGVNPAPNDSHSMRAWNDELTGRTYVAMIDNVEDADVDILDVTDPRKPVLVNDTLNLIQLFGVQQEDPASLTEVFSHDMDVYRVGDRYVMTLNYWDGGYVLLDVTDPALVTLIAESDYAALDEEQLARGREIAPEGNAHQSELSPDQRFLIGTDEDFSPTRATLTIDAGRYAGTQAPVAQAPDTPPVQEGDAPSGPTTYLGLGCDPAAIPPGTGIALVERGVCPFQDKLDNIAGAGYAAGIVFNAPVEGCDALVSMQATGAIPFWFVGRTTGLQLLDVAGVTPQSACTTASPAPGAPGVAATMRAVFDGWGYVRLFGTDIPGTPGAAGSIEQIDTYAVEESQDPGFATGFGDLSVHEVAMDPDTQGVAYLSYYAAGIRVVEYDDKGITEVASFVDDEGSNFWGVEVWYDEDGTKYLLASDRDYGLYVFRYPPADKG